MRDTARLAVPPSDEAVERFLAERPGWLAQRPALFGALEPPERVHGEALADHMAAMLRHERAHAASARRAVDQVVEDRRAAVGLAGRVQRSVLALIAAADPVECVSAELAGLLGVDAAALCSEGPARRGIRALPAGALAALLGGRDVVVRASPPGGRALHAEAAPLACHEALVRVPARPGCLLLLASRDAGRLGADREALAFLGRAVAAAMGRG
ncbi:MAG: hypothetical protein ACRYGC_04615 [Janthinobacterium lividum]